jgi:myo-inositol-1(or 4)-monophosphatase
MHMCSGIRRPGAAALDLAWVAAGRSDGFWEMGLSPWDMCAGASSCARPGPRGRLLGQREFMETGRIVATNPKIFASMLKVLKGR